MRTIAAAVLVICFFLSFAQAEDAIDGKDEMGTKQLEAELESLGK